MSNASTAYFCQRAVSERALALRAERADVAEIHEELARLYQELVDNDVLRPKLRAAEDKIRSSS